MKRFCKGKTTNFAVKTIFILLLISPAILFAETSYWTVDNCGDLNREQISLMIDGKKANITEFYMSQEKPESLHSSLWRKWIVLVDTEFSSQEDLVRSKALAKAVVEKARPEDLILISTISSGGLKHLSMLSLDRSQSLTAINSIELTTKDDKKGEDARGIIIGGFTELAFQLSVIHGRKTILLFSPGFNTEGLKAHDTSEHQAPELVMEEVDEEERLEWQKERTDRKEQGPKYDLSKIPELFAGAGAEFNVISNNSNEFYRSIVNKTKGKLLTENAQASLDQLLNSIDFCALGWNASTEKEFKKTHELKIESGSKVITESPWIAPRNLVSLSSEERKLKAWDALYIGGSSATPFRFLADSIFQDGEQRIPIFAEVPAVNILKQGGSQALFEFYGFSTASDGKVLDSFFIPIQLDLKNKKLKERITRSGLKMWNVLSGGNQVANVRWVILDLSSDQVVTHNQNVEAPPHSLTVSRPFFPDLNLDWILWPAPNSITEREGKQIRYPYTAGTDYFFPDLSPTLVKNDGGILYMRLYNKPPASKNPPIVLKIKGPDEKQVAIDQFQLLQKPATLENNGLELFWKIGSFPPAQQGACVLQVQIQDSDSQKVITRELPLEIQ